MLPKSYPMPEVAPVINTVSFFPFILPSNAGNLIKEAEPFLTLRLYILSFKN
jgi:hypothetical protein